MEQRKDSPISANHLSPGQRRSRLNGLQIAVTLIVTVSAVAFLLYVTILVYGFMIRM